jgi:hypothetical protein
MRSVLLLQLPIPRQNYGRRTGNIPLAAACLKQAAGTCAGVQVDILPESVVSYLGDAALLERILDLRPEVVGFSVFSWNVERSLEIAARLKSSYGLRIVFGGPEVTAESPLLSSAHVDFAVCGEGEAVFKRLLMDEGFWQRRTAAGAGAEAFRRAPSPYLAGLLEPEIESLMLLETQRGCPYRCGFCYYNQSRPQRVAAADGALLQAIRWAIARGLREVYLLDPSLNTRRGLKPLLAAIARLNAERRIRLFSEIRAEAVDVELADRLAAAGVTWLEVGLQSTNPRALTIMNRPTRLSRFLDGARLLKERGITPSIDLILGLPGDDLGGFMRSVDFVADHGLQDDVQIFPLAVLPGTEFRRRSRELGLRWEPQPPYTVLETDTFKAQEFLLAYDYAETRLDATFFPLPDLDLAWRIDGEPDISRAADVGVRLGGAVAVAKLVVTRGRPLKDIRQRAGRLTQPYQLLVAPGAGEPAFLKKVLAAVTAQNPFTPFEVVFFDPTEPPRVRELLAAVRLRRPHFLDGDLRYLFAAPGNRAVLFTLVTAEPRVRFQGDMERQVFWWRRLRLPRLGELTAFAGLDGVLIDSPVSAAAVRRWQDRNGPQAAEAFHISFAEVALQKRWLLLTAPDEYAAQAMGYLALQPPFGRMWGPNTRFR